MQGAPEPAQPALRRPAGRTLGVLLVAAALALGACGGSDDDDAKLKLPANFNLQLFKCADWNVADEPVRRYVIDRLRVLSNDQITGPGVRGRGSVLTDDEARKLFDGRCADPRARGFVLYKLYAFARGFRGSAPPGT